MKNRNRRYPRSSGMDRDKSGESGAFLFSQRVPDFCDGRRLFPTNENSNLNRRGRRLWISLITNPLNCWAPIPLSQINMASLENLGQTSGDYPIYRQNLGWSAKSKIPERFYCFPTVPDFANKWKLEIVDIPNRLGWTVKNSGESGAFLFSRRVSDFCDGRRPFPTNENSYLYRQGRRQWVSLITNLLNCWAPVPRSKINKASLQNTETVLFPIRKLKDWDLELPACKVSQCHD